MAMQACNTAPNNRRTADRKRGRTNSNPDPRESAERAAAILAAGGLLRLPDVLALVPVSPSTWWEGIRSGRFPAGVKLSERCTAWRAADIAALLESFNPEASA